MALYSRGVITCLVCLNPQNPRRGTLIYVLGIIILIDGILVIEGIGRYCTLVSVSMILFCFCVGVVWEVPGIYSRYLVGIYSIRYTCMKAYIKRIMIKFIL